MNQCVPEWNRDHGNGGGCYTLDDPGVGDLVPREGHNDDGPFTGTADDFWPWWDWDLDDVTELKWADGQPRVQAGTISKPTTPTNTPTGTSTLITTSPPADTACGVVEDFDLERWLCAAADEGRRPAASGASDQAADAIVPGSTGRLLGPADTRSCLLVPDMMAPVEAAPAASCILGSARQERKRRLKALEAGEGEDREQLGGAKRRRAQQQQQQYHVEQLQVACTRQLGQGQGEGEGQRHDEISGRCSTPANKARCRSTMSERKRRDKFNQKIRTLQKLVPNCGKVDKVSILDEVITHVRQLQAQTQMHMMTGADARLSVSPPPPMMMPATSTPMAAYMQQQFQIMAQMAAQMSQMFRMGLAGANSFFPQPPSPLMNFSSPSFMPRVTAAEQHMMVRSENSRSTAEGFAASFAQP